MKLRYLSLLVVAMVSLAFGRSVQPVLAQSGNETAPAIIIQTGTTGPGNGTPQPALTQSGNETVRFKNVMLEVNPEYDDPRLLVMLEGDLDGVTAPVRVRFLVPEAAEMYSAGSLTARGGQGYTGGPPERTASQIPGWDEISYTLQTDTFRMEYYDSVIPNQPDKKISYDFRTISPISDLRVVVQQPRKSTDFTVTPQGTAGKDVQGFTIYSSYYYNLIAGAPLHFDIAYTGSETKPSLGSGGPGGTSTGSSSLGSVILIVLGVAAIGGVILWLLKSRQPRYVPVRASGKPPKKRSAKKGNQGNLTDRVNQGNRFCTRCGQPATASDKFCTSCGSKLRDST